MKRKYIYSVVGVLCLILLIYVINICVKKDSNDSIRVFFNKSVNLKYGKTRWGDVNLEDELIKRINGAERTVDVCIYEINLPGIVQELIDKAAEGIRVRVIVDGKETGDNYRDKRYALMRLYLEKMMRGEDGIIGTDDDVHIFSDSPVFMVQDSWARETFGLPKKIEDDRRVHLKVGRGEQSGYIISKGEIIRDETFASYGNQMHNKFVVVDGKSLWTGSWNFTVTGLYGSYSNAKSGILDGNQQHCMFFENENIAQVYLDEFNEMWGSEGEVPNSTRSNFSRRKRRKDVKTVRVGDSIIRIYFSPSEEGLKEIKSIIGDDNRNDFYLSLFCISDMDIMKALMERNSEEDSTVKMVIDDGMWSQGWSAVKRVMKDVKYIPVFEDSTKGKLHSKSAVIDPFDQDSVVIFGSMNWTKNGYTANDENLMIIYNLPGIAEKFYGEILSRVNESRY